MIGSNTRFSAVSSKIQKVTRGSEKFIILQGRERLISKRLERREVARYKWHRAYAMSRWYRLIPSVSLVGVTGGLAMENAKEGDDIDLFFITSSHTIWITRFLVTLVTQLCGVRRKPKAAQEADAICLNMFMAQSSLTLIGSEQDLFAAHEVLQMRPLWQRGRVYHEFLSSNSWVKKFLPTAWEDKLKHSVVIGEKPRRFGFLSVINMCASLLEPLAKFFQLWYMQKRRTTEVIEQGVLRFHPKDARFWVKKSLHYALKNPMYYLTGFFSVVKIAVTSKDC